MQIRGISQIKGLNSLNIKINDSGKDIKLQEEIEEIKEVLNKQDK